MLKFEFTVKEINIFVKNIKKATSGMFTAMVSQFYHCHKFTLLHIYGGIKFISDVNVC